MFAERQIAGLWVDDLNPGETALICAARAIAIGHGDCHLIRGLLAHQGRDPDGALAHLLAFVRLIGWRGTRSIGLNLPGSTGVSGDEVLILEAMAAAERGTGPSGAARLERAVAALMGGAADPCVTAAAMGFAAALARAEPPPGPAARHQTYACR